VEGSAWKRLYLRLQEAYPKLKELKQNMAAGASLLPLVPISKTLADKALANTVLSMREKVTIFDQLREAMRMGAALLERRPAAKNRGVGTGIFGYLVHLVRSPFHAASLAARGIGGPG
jgi:hypothetical protein